MAITDSIQFGALFGSYTTFTIALLCLLAISMSAYVKIATVLGIVRVGLGFASLPSIFVTGSLAIALSYCVMFPVIKESSTAMNNVLSSQANVTDELRYQAIASGIEAWSGFLVRYSHRQEVQRFNAIANRMDTKQSDKADVSSGLHVLAPAFLVSQLKEAFSIGLRIFLPFVVVDLIVSLLVTAVGIDTRVSISLGFASKLLLFVMCDGWGLITGSLVSSYV